MLTTSVVDFPRTVVENTFVVTSNETVAASTLTGTGDSTGERREEHEEGEQLGHQFVRKAF